MSTPVGARILIVEDDPLFLASMRALLTGSGYLVRGSLSSTDASLDREIAAADLVILDLSMPQRDGFDILKQIRETPSTRNKPVLMLTAHDPMNYRLRGLTLGADDYVVKPPNHQELLLRISGLLRRSSCVSQPAGGRVMIDQGSGGRTFVEARDIIYIEAARNYCYVHTYEGRKLTSASIGQLEETLGERFVRAHRSYLVNPAAVRSAKWQSKSAYVLELDSPDNAVVPVSRAYRESVRVALGLVERAAPSSARVTTA